MKLVIFAFLGLLFASCAHTNKDTIKSEDATLRICPKNITGCADKIITNKMDYLIDPVTEDATKSFIEITKKRNTNNFKEIKITAQGYTVKELGHFPNPMAEFDVFKLMVIKTK